MSEQEQTAADPWEAVNQARLAMRAAIDAGDTPADIRATLKAMLAELERVISGRRTWTW